MEKYRPIPPIEEKPREFIDHAAEILKRGPRPLEKPLNQWQEDLLSVLKNESSSPPPTVSPKEVSINNLPQDSSLRNILEIIEQSIIPSKEDNRLCHIAQNPIFGFTISKEGKVILQPINMEELRTYRFNQMSHFEQAVVERFHLMGRIHKSDMLKYVIYIDSNNQKNTESLIQNSLLGNISTDQPTYLQWGDKDVVTYGKLKACSTYSCIEFYINQKTLAEKRNIFIDPETTHPTFGGMVNERINELPGDAVIIFGGIPKEAIIGCSFNKNEIKFIVPEKHLRSEIQ